MKPCSGVSLIEKTDAPRAYRLPAREGFAAAAFGFRAASILVPVTMVAWMLVVMMAMTMVIMIMRMAVIVAMMIMACMRRVGPAFRIERRLDRREPCAERGEHRLERGIAPQPDPVRQHLDRDVPVAEMPGEPREMRQVVAADFGERFGFDHDFNQVAAVELERIAHAQCHGLGSISPIGVPFTPVRCAVCSRR